MPHEVNKSLLIAAGGTAIASMVLDFLQYFASYLTVMHTWANRRKVEGRSDEYTYEYDYNLIRYKAQTWFFWTKQIALAASFVCLVRAFWVALFG